MLTNFTVSNLIQAISTMRSMVRRSVRLNEGDALPYDPFALDEIPAPLAVSSAK